ncbi:MAG: deoxyribonuclease IV [Coriobacteriia bacterium]|nr:deoxyribonuclease IV [Coriobacteriia bacterium]
MKIGAHVSIAKGLSSAVEYAESVGCECFQIFAKSPRQWHGPPLDPDAVELYLETLSASEISAAFTHTAYLLNLATAEPLLRRRSIVALTDELVRGAELGVAGVITHVGSDPHEDPSAAAQRVADAVRDALAAADAHATRRVDLLLENTAGAGRTYGGPIEHLAAVFALLGDARARVGLCLDTCHAHAFGYDVRTDVGWDQLLGLIRDQCGGEAIRAVHANDCVAPVGSHRDRHAWVGDGEIGLPGFSAMLRREELAEVCAITEMPGELPAKDILNIQRLKMLRGECDSG